MSAAAFVFPAVKGKQAKREYYISMVPLEIIPRIFQFADEELPPEIRSQRVLNRARIPGMRDYILNNPDGYVFSAMTVSVDGAMEFSSITENDPLVGHITIPMNARFLINDGQHRRAAIAEAIKKDPTLKDEHISVVFYHDEGLTRSQQMFSDLNRYAIRPTKSINILYNGREESSVIAKSLLTSVPVFRNYTELEKTTLSHRAKALFTLSAICNATEQLLKDVSGTTEEKTNIATKYWEKVTAHMPQWIAVKDGHMRASDVRQDYISSLSLTMMALGSGGSALLKAYPDTWEHQLLILDQINWRKENPVWENLLFANGKLATNRSTQINLCKHFEALLTNEIGENTCQI